jgi:hypothetical protein
MYCPVNSLEELKRAKKTSIQCQAYFKTGHFPNRSQKPQALPFKPSCSVMVKRDKPTPLPAKRVPAVQSTSLTALSLLLFISKQQTFCMKGRDKWAAFHIEYIYRSTNLVHYKYAYFVDKVREIVTLIYAAWL